MPKPSLEEPILCCDVCYKRAKKGELCQSPFRYDDSNRNCDGWGYVPFNRLMNLSDKDFAVQWLSKSIFEPNALARKDWRKKLWRLKKIWQWKQSHPTP